MVLKVSTFRNLILVVLIVAIGMTAKYFYQKPGFTAGESAPEIAAALASGTEFKLSALRGRFVLLDFWGSWCGPCRAQSPALVNLYDKYKEAKFANAQGFDIVSIGIERKEDSWRRAIQKDGKLWPYQILDKATSLRFFNSPIAELYGVKALPAKFLISPDGQIIGVDMQIREIDHLLNAQLEHN